MIMNDFTKSMEKVSESRFVEERDEVYQNQNYDIGLRVYELEHMLDEERHRTEQAQIEAEKYLKDSSAALQEEAEV